MPFGSESSNFLGRFADGERESAPFVGNFVANFVDERRECWDFDKASDIMFSQKTSWDRL